MLESLQYFDVVALPTCSDDNKTCMGPTYKFKHSAISILRDSKSICYPWQPIHSTTNLIRSGNNPTVSVMNCFTITARIRSARIANSYNHYTCTVETTDTTLIKLNDQHFETETIMFEPRSHPRGRTAEPHSHGNTL